MDVSSLLVFSCVIYVVFEIGSKLVKRFVPVRLHIVIIGIMVANAGGRWHLVRGLIVELWHVRGMLLMHRMRRLHLV